MFNWRILSNAVLISRLSKMMFSKPRCRYSTLLELESYFSAEVLVLYRELSQAVTDPQAKRDASDEEKQAGRAEGLPYASTGYHFGCISLRWAREASVASGP